MKPLFLEFCNINSFSERTEVDFSRLLEYGIFGIFGDTGSGKSTILDCIGFALYGSVARSRSGSIADVIHYAADRAYVHLEFEIVFEGKRRRFYVERELKRKNAAQALKVYERQGDKLITVADGVREGNALLERIIGLEQRDFEKCIALPQGEFAQFVRAARGERLKLVSRLFDLEAYGEGLTRRAGGKVAEAREARNVTAALLEPFEGLSEEMHAALRARIAELSEGEKKLEASLAALREREKTLSVKAELRAEQETLLAKMERLEEKKPAMRQLKEALARLAKAQNCLRDREDALRAAQLCRGCERALDEAEALLARAQKRREEAASFDLAAAQERIEALTERLARAQADELRRSQLAKAQKAVEECENKLAGERMLYADFHYEEELKRLQNELAALGSGDFLSFAEEHGKAMLLHGEYAQFAEELTSLTQKHPVIDGDSRPLIEKYTRLSAGERTDFAQLRTAYEKREAAREDVRNRLSGLEKRKGRYDAHLQSLQMLSEQRSAAMEQVRALSEGAPQEEFSSEAVQAQLGALREERTRRMKEADEVQAALTKALADRAAAQSQAAAARESERAANARLARSLEEGAFANAEDAAALCAKLGDAESAAQRVQEYSDAYVQVYSRLKELSSLDLSEGDGALLAAVREELKQTDARLKECVRELALARGEFARSEEGLIRKAQLKEQLARHDGEVALYERLRKLLEGNKFMEFIAEEYLQTVAENASGRLLSLTDGRYFLRYEGGFYVGDNFNGGELRGVYTLSGGETFLVSLSLALALSAEICARSLRPIEFFFLDEGFGTLDEHLIDVVMDSLERLKNEHFSIGIISHVEELKHRIGRKLSVKKATERHGSQIVME